MHQSYEDILNHPPDFRVRYKFPDENSGESQKIPYQGNRLDFSYEAPNHPKTSVFMILPEFENESGDIILNTNTQIQNVGTARMWIINSQLRKYHQEHISLGTKGCIYFGGINADCEVIEIIGLHDNPVGSD